MFERCSKTLEGFEMYMLFITYVHVVFSVDFYANILQRLDSIVMYVFIRMYILSLCIIILLALTTHLRGF